MENIRQRTYKFSLKIVEIVNNLPKTTAGIALGKQLIRSGTSIGANSEEADGAYTKSEFTYHINIAKKEAKETKYWLRIVFDSNILPREKFVFILDECEQIIKILSKSVITAQKKSIEV